MPYIQMRHNRRKILFDDVKICIYLLHEWRSNRWTPQFWLSLTLRIRLTHRWRGHVYRIIQSASVLFKIVDILTVILLCLNTSLFIQYNGGPWFRIIWYSSKFHRFRSVRTNHAPVNALVRYLCGRVTFNLKKKVRSVIRCGNRWRAVIQHLLQHRLRHCMIKRCSPVRVEI